MKKLCSFIVLVFFTFGQDVLGNKRHRHFKSGDDDRIVGGYSTTIRKVPYQAFLALQKGEDFYQCGGSIISDQYILTAAHCVKGFERAFIRIGSSKSNSGGKKYISRSMRAHPQFNNRTYDYDVAVIRTTQNMILDGTNAKAIKLAESENESDPIARGTEVLVSGWGDTSENGQSTTDLMAVRVPVVSNNECNKTYNGDISVRMFCAGEPEGGKDSCQGDSGGPAVEESEGVQLGIVSFGVGCARAKYPGVYTKVAGVRKWIRFSTRDTV